MEANAPKQRRGLASFALIALIVAATIMSGFTLYNANQTNAASQSGLSPTNLTMAENLSYFQNSRNLLDQINVGLNLRVLNPDGSMVSNTSYPDDIITNQFVEFFGNFLGGNNCFNLNAVGGSGKSVCNEAVSPFVTAYACCYTYFYDGGDGGYIGIGTGTVAPARTDSALESQVGSWTPISPPVVSGTSVIVASGITLTAAETISEAGFALQTGGWTTTQTPAFNTNGLFLFFHDTFTGISVAADQTLQVQYTLNFPSTANQNLVALVGSMFQYVAQSYSGTYEDNIAPMVDSSGTTHAAGSLRVWYGVATNGCSASYLTCTATPLIEVGTSTTAPTDTDYQLNAQVGSTTDISTTTIDMTKYEVLYRDTMILTSTYTIQEAGLFYSGEWSGVSGNLGSIHFLLFHSLTGAIPVSANNAITTQYTLGF
jgi:hypothetical protein